MVTLRDYQTRALAEVATYGDHRVVLVSPTGSGKTVMGAAYAQQHQRDGVLWICHRTELLTQAAGALRALGLRVGLIAPREPADPLAPIQVATVQTLLARADRPPAGTIVLDEAHHYTGTTWADLCMAGYPSARVLGLTATPQRADGVGLGDVFQGLVVAAQYPDLLAAGHLVPCRVYQPPAAQRRSLALDPIAAWSRYGEARQTFAFCRTVQAAQDLAIRFRDELRVPAACIHGMMPARVRRDALAAFRDGSLTVLTTVYVLTEGVDVPAASCCLVARSVGHAGAYLQMAGRVLRPAPGKDDAILIDLSGATLAHGLPTDAREYTLEGDGIRRSQAPPLRTCLQCGAVFSPVPHCPRCGYEFVVQQPEVRIYSQALREVYAGADTGETARRAEYDRLRSVARDRGYGIAWVAREYRRLFKANPPWLSELLPDEKRMAYVVWAKQAKARGFKAGWAAVQYRNVFGVWPGRWA